MSAVMPRQCATCTRTLPLDAFRLRKNGNPQSQCRQCDAADCARRRVESPVYVPDPLNLALREWRA